jgi:hypothetical protein
MTMAEKKDFQMFLVMLFDALACISYGGSLVFHTREDYGPILSPHVRHGI